MRAVACFVLSAIALQTVATAREAPAALRQAGAMHHRHHGRLQRQPVPMGPEAYTGQPVLSGTRVPPGGYDNPLVNNGSFTPQFAPNDPQRPYGAYSTVTAPPGTEAAQEQENNRRYFCNFAPEHC